MNYLITGGTGSMGQKLTEYLLKNPSVKRIVIYSRDEFKQGEMAKKIADKRVRYFLGDIRDKKRLKLALAGINWVVHAAALKVVPKLEYDPIEAVQTNIYGTQNVIEACMETGVERAVLLSTDKAVEPINLYGMTKAVAEKLFTNACFFKPIFSVARYGNVMGSRGSVLELYRRRWALDDSRYPLTSPGMTRFWMSFAEGIELIMTAFKGLPQVIYVPKCRTFDMKSLIEAFHREPEYIGARPGEKIAEVLINKYEALHTIKLKYHYEILPLMPYDNEINFNPEKAQCLNLPLTSAEHNMGIEEIRRLL